MSWNGEVRNTDEFRFFVEHELSRLDGRSSKIEWKYCLANLKPDDLYVWNERKYSGVFPSQLWSFLHHAAYHSAPREIVQKLNIKRMPLSLPDGEGKLAVEHVKDIAPDSYKQLFEPVYRVDFLALELKLMQMNFHEVIKQLVSEEMEEHNLVLPVLSVFLEDISPSKKELSFNLSAEDRGFLFWFVSDETGQFIVSLLVQTTCSGWIEIYECNSSGWKLLEKRSALIK